MPQAKPLPTHAVPLLPCMQTPRSRLHNFPFHRNVPFHPAVLLNPPSPFTTQPVVRCLCLPCHAHLPRRFGPPPPRLSHPQAASFSCRKLDPTPNKNTCCFCVEPLCARRQALEASAELQSRMVVCLARLHWVSLAANHGMGMHALLVSAGRGCAAADSRGALVLCPPIAYCGTVDAAAAWGSAKPSVSNRAATIVQAAGGRLELSSGGRTPPLDAQATAVQQAARTTHLQQPHAGAHQSTTA